MAQNASEKLHLKIKGGKDIVPSEEILEIQRFKSWQSSSCPTPLISFDSATPEEPILWSVFYSTFHGNITQPTFKALQNSTTASTQLFFCLLSHSTYLPCRAPFLSYLEQFLPHLFLVPSVKPASLRKSA